MLNELAPDVHWMAPDHTTDRPVVAAIAGEQATLLVDAGSSVEHARRFLTSGISADASTVSGHVTAFQAGRERAGNDPDEQHHARRGDIAGGW